MVRGTGDVLGMSPPLSLEQAHIGQLVERRGKAIGAAA
jgi:adenosylmethionine-8-amino-7-oxononanoate aminotransferase